MQRGRLGRRPRGFVAGVALAGALTAAPVVSGGAAMPAATATAGAPTPVAAWSLGDGSGSIAHDTAGSRDGVLHGAVTFGAVGQGPTQSAAAFDGRSGYIEVPVDATTTPVAAAAAWVRLARGATGGIVLDGTPFAIGVAAGRPVARACGPGGCAIVRAATDVRDGEWHQLAVSASGGSLVLYVDGGAAARGALGGVDAWHGGAVIGAALHGDVDRVVLYAAPLAPSDVAADFRSGACPQQAAAAPAPATARLTLPALPLHTRGRFVVDAHGRRVKLAGVNWYGAEELDHVPAGLQCQSVDAIAGRIAAAGFNVVRLPWSTDAWVRSAPAVPPVAVAANPQLRGLDARRVFDAVVAALARRGVMVVLDNHVSRADWCCSGSDGNALWWQGYDPAHAPAWSRLSAAARARVFQAGQQQWLRAWTSVVSRYAPRGAHPTSAVVGAELRNEPRTDALLRITPVWTAKKVAPWQDWARAAETGGATVLRANPRLLVVVDGVHYANDLTGAASRLIRLPVAHRLVYGVHDYAFFHGNVSYTSLRTRLGQRWGYLLANGHRWTAPVWVSEWGACHPDGPACGDSGWLAGFTHYLRDGDIDFAYWSVNGTGARGRDEPVTCAQTLRFPGCPEGYGISDTTWAADASPALSATLHALVPATQR